MAEGDIDAVFIIGGGGRKSNPVDVEQFEDYSKYAAIMFDAEANKKHHWGQFPKDCEAAFELGRRLSKNIF